MPQVRRVGVVDGSKTRQSPGGREPAPSGRTGNTARSAEQVSTQAERAAATRQQEGPPRGRRLVAAAEGCDDLQFADPGVSQLPSFAGTAGNRAPRPAMRGRRVSAGPTGLGSVDGPDMLEFRAMQGSRRPRVETCMTVRVPALAARMACSRPSEARISWPHSARGSWLVRSPPSNRRPDSCAPWPALRDGTSAPPRPVRSCRTGPRRGRRTLVETELRNDDGDWWRR
jgi:hypothetical protein